MRITARVIIVERLTLKCHQNISLVDKGMKFGTNVCQIILFQNIIVGHRNFRYFQNGRRYNKLAAF